MIGTRYWVRVRKIQVRGTNHKAEALKNARGAFMDEKKSVKDFEDLKVYKKSESITEKIYSITNKEKFARDYALVTQIRRASVSVMSNIAEGFDRGSNKDFMHFLYISKGSNAEVRCQLNIALKLGYISESEHKEIKEEIIELGKMLRSFIEYLESSDIKKR